MTETTFIYSLADPRTNEPRYVGKANDPSYRFICGHMCDKSTTYKCNWVKSLKKQNLKPILNIIDEVYESDWQFWEMYYISFYKSKGYRLTNGDNGGLGRGRVSNEMREKISNTLKGHIAWNKGIKHSLERIKKQSVDNPNKKFVSQIDINTNQIIDIYESLAAVGKHLEVGYSSISLAIKEPYRTCKGYKWRFSTQQEIENCKNIITKF